MNFRLGTTSYILPAGLLENVGFLANSVQDMELVLFDLEDGQTNIPSVEIVRAMRRIADESDFSYTVHLPLDLKWRDETGNEHQSLKMAQRTISATKDLHPIAYVAHLDGRLVSDWQNKTEKKNWQRQALLALEKVADWAGGWEKISLENLEGYPLDYLDELFLEVPIKRCVDIGHWWLDGHNPLKLLTNGINLERVSVIHIHGISHQGEAHHSLAYQSRVELAEILSYLKTAGYSGVLTLEVFGIEDFQSSLRVIQEIL